MNCMSIVILCIEAKIERLKYYFKNGCVDGNRFVFKSNLFSCKSFLFRFSSPLTLWKNIWFKIQWLHHIVVEIYFQIFIIIFIFSGHPLQNEEQYSYDDPSDYDYGDDEEIEEEKEISYDVNFMNSGETFHVDKGTTIRLPCYIDTFPGKTISNYYLLPIILNSYTIIF